MEGIVEGEPKHSRPTYLQQVRMGLWAIGSCDRPAGEDTAPTSRPTIQKKVNCHPDRSAPFLAHAVEGPAVFHSRVFSVLSVVNPALCVLCVLAVKSLSGAVKPPTAHTTPQLYPIKQDKRTNSWRRISRISLYWK
jgi:hypothetical protein